MTALLEAAAALCISGAVMALVSSSLVGALRVHSASCELEDELFRIRQLEHLVDRAVVAAGAGPSHPPAVASVTADTIVFASDQNGDGIVDAASSETTALEVRHTSGDARVRIKLGRQTMTVLEEGESTATVEAYGLAGASADASHATLVALTIRPSDAPDDGKTLLFSVPARTLP